MRWAPLADQGARGDGADAHRVYVVAQRLEQFLFDIQLAATLEHRGRGGRRGETHRVELSPGDLGDQLVECAAQWRWLPAVHPNGHHLGPRRAEAADKLGEGIPAIGRAV